MIQYFISQEKKTVVAFDSDAADNFVTEIAKFWNIKFGSSYLPNELIEKFRKILDEMKKVRGVAKCSPLDDFSEDIGVNLAKARLINKLSVLRGKFYREISRYLSEARNTAVDRYLGNDIKKLKCEEIEDNLSY